jgi:hypothetical protein
MRLLSSLPCCAPSPAQKDYTGPLNQAEARYRCGGDYAGLCDIKVAYLDKDKKLFGHGLCQYPSLTTILTRIGSAMGLFNGILITLRSNIRSSCPPPNFYACPAPNEEFMLYSPVTDGSSGSCT